VESSTHYFLTMCNLIDGLGGPGGRGVREAPERPGSRAAVVLEAAGLPGWWPEAAARPSWTQVG